MNFRPSILITNDDGIYAKGIFHLWQALRNTCDVNIIAPATEQSCVGMGITLRKPLHIHQVDWAAPTPAWSVSGTPADCVKLGFKEILDKKPDLVVSGINRGTNAGRNVLYSGTVAGTIEAVLKGVPGIAFSCYDYDDPNFARAEPYISQIVNYVMQHPLPSGTLLNVNFPPASKKIQGFKMARQGKGIWEEMPEKRHHPLEGHVYYWLGAKTSLQEEHEEADMALLQEGYVTAVPIKVAELTDHDHLQSYKHSFEQFFFSS